MKKKLLSYPSPLGLIHLNFFFKNFTSFPAPRKSSLGSFALFLMVFFITRWSIQLRLIEHEVGSIWEAIYQTEGARPHWSPPAVIICALVPAASGTPEPQMASDMFTECATKQEERPLCSPLSRRNAGWLQVILVNPKCWIYFSAMLTSCYSTIY